MLACTPAPLKKQRYRKRQRDGIIVLHLEVHEHEFAEALLLSERLSEDQARAAAGPARKFQLAQCVAKTFRRGCPVCAPAAV